MVKVAQEWLDENYPKEQRSEIKFLSIVHRELDFNGSLNLNDFTNLETLYCCNNSLTSLDLSKCSKLSYLECQVNQLTELKLNPYAKLTTLNAHDNNLTDLKSLNSLKASKGSLKYLVLANNNFPQQSLEIFSNFTNLEELDIGNYYREKSVKDRINKENIYNKFNGSLEPLKNLDNLKKLVIRNTDIKDNLECLPKNLEKICVSCEERPNSEAKKIVEQLKPFHDKKGARYDYDFQKWLKVNKNKKSIDAEKWLKKTYPKIEKSKDIKELDLRRKNLKGELDLKEFVNLKKLIINPNSLESEKPWEEFKIGEIDELGLSECSNLKYLDCSFNELEKLDVSNSYKLETLLCSYNQLGDLKIVAENLTILSCAHNKLKDTKFLASLPNQTKKNLTFLDISDNNFSPQTLDFLKEFTNLEELYVENWDTKRKKKSMHKRFFSFWKDLKDKEEICNCFYGSLKFLKDMENLKKLNISNTDIDKGLKYLPKSLNEFVCNDTEGSFDCKKIEEELKPYNGKIIKWREEWEKDKLAILEVPPKNTIK